MRALIAAGGEPPTKEQAYAYADAKLVIAADSGAEWLYEYGIMPHIFLGDMDSVSAKVREYYSKKGVETVKYPSEKNATDTMIAAEYALKAGADEIVLLGGGGGRQDHTYANYQAMAYIASRKVKAVMPCAESVCFMSCSKLELDVTKGQTLSILPFGGDVRVTSLEGELKYPVKDLLLPVFYPDPCGVSNVALSSKLHLSFDGMALITLDFDE